MEVIIQRTDGTPVSSREAEMVLNKLRNRLAEVAAEQKDTAKKYEIEILVEEDSACLYAMAVCPGIRKEQIEISVDGCRLCVTAKPAEKCEEDGGSRHHFRKYVERLEYHGECDLPTEIMAEEAEADLSDGILYITMPKPEAVKPKMIPVK